MAGESSMSYAIALQRSWMHLSRFNEAAIPAAILAVGLIATGSTESISLFGLRLPDFCPFKNFTGFDCPGCGLTRALILVLHGHWRASYMMHLWGIPLAAFFIWRLVAGLYFGFTGQRTPVFLPPHLRLWKSRLLGLSLLVPWIMKTTALLLIR
jgi:Protein of unknown function (DUF2752)